MVTRHVLGLVALSLLVTLLNACKPLTVDDPDYYSFALHIAENPSDPYGFDLDRGEPAMQTLAPPVLLYWLAGAVRMLGQEIWLCKLSLAPFGLLFTLALYDLFRRFCPGLAGRLTAVTVLSPAFLPSWNLMLDLPALALALASLVLFLRAADRGSLRLATFAGLTAGLAMQTKYSAFVVPAVMLWYCFLQRRVGLGILAAGLAVAVFAAWEVWLIHVYGVSHFLHAAGQRAGAMIHRARLVFPLVSILGGIAPWLELLGLAALGSRRLGLATLAVAAGFVAIALLPAEWQLLRPTETEHGLTLPLANVLFAVLGCLLACTLRRVCRRLAQAPADGAATAFLVGWLILELVGYLILSPFAAVRRVLGLQVVATLLVGRLAATTMPAARAGLCWGLGLGAALGLGYWLVDFRETLTERRAAEEAYQWVRRQSTETRIRFAGHYPFHFYAFRCGMLPLAKEERPEGQDWLVLAPVEPPLGEDVTAGRTCHELVFTDALPLRTRPNFYAGGRPIEHLGGARLVVRIYEPRGESP